MTPATLKALQALRAAKPGKNGYTRTQVQKALTGSEGEKVRRALGILSGVTVAKLDGLLSQEPQAPVVTPPVEVPVPPKPQEPAKPPVEPSEGVRSLLNEQVFMDTSGNRINFQNDGKPGSTEYLGGGHYKFRLPAVINGVIQGQRPSERVPKGTKRRSEGSGIKVPRPVGDQVVVVGGRYKFKPQPFAANQQWVMPFQLHGAGKTGSPWFAVRVEKDGWWLGTINTSVDGKSTNLRPSPRFKPEPDVWHESEVQWSAERLAIFHDGKLVAEHVGPIGWDEEGVPYLKWGVYNSQGSTEETEVEVMDLTVNGKPVGIIA